MSDSTGIAESPYMRTVLEGEANAIRAHVGGRNVQLYKSACAVLGFVKSGALKEETAREHLWAVAADTGMTEKDIETVWRSAMQRAEPRHAPLPTAGGWRAKVNAIQRREAAKPLSLPRSVTPKQSADWQARAARLASIAFALLRQPQGEAGRAYLHGRGLLPDTWDAYNLGFRVDAPLPGTKGKERAPAIVFPWYGGRRVVGLRYRFIADNPHGKASSEYGSRFSLNNVPVLFGTAALDWDEDRTTQTVALVEGEINAMSIHQVTGWHVFSYGSEGSTTLHPKQIRFLNQYKSVIVWADKPNIARKLQAQLPVATAMQSPQGMDANDLLLAGVLAPLLKRM